MDATFNSITYLIVQGVNLHNDSEYSLPAGQIPALPHPVQLAQPSHDNQITVLPRLLQRPSTSCELQNEITRLRNVVYELLAANDTCRRELGRECQAHSHTREALMSLRHSNTNIEHQHRQAISKLQAALKAVQDELSLEKEKAASLATELKHAQKKFHLVDNLVNAQLHEKGWVFAKPLQQITDITLGLEGHMEERYWEIIAVNEQQVAKLKAVLYQSGGWGRHEGRCDRSQSEPLQLN